MWMLVLVASAIEPSTASSTAPTASSTAPPYAVWFEQSLARITAAHPEEAIALLEDLTAAYPQDYAAWLLLGRAAFEAKQWSLAVRAFGEAVTLSDRSTEAVTGLAWSHARLGNHDEARTLFAEIAPLRPQAARDGERFLQQTAFWATQGFGALGGLWYPAHPALDGGLGLSLGIAGHAGPATATLTVRGVGLMLDTSADAYALARGNGQQSLLDQPGLYFAELDTFASVGLDQPSWGLHGHYHLGVDTVPGATSLRHSLGASGWWRTVGVLGGEVSGSTFDDVAAVRLALSWRHPLGLGWYITPGVAGQVVGNAPRGSLAVSGGWASAGSGVFVSVKGGPEERPVYLSSALAYPLTDIMVGGAVLGGSVSVNRHHVASATVEVVALSPTTTVSSSTLTTAWFAQLGWTFGQLRE